MSDLLQFEQATKEDSLLLADYLYQASGGMKEYMLAKVDVTKTPVELLATFIEKDQGEFSWQHFILAREDGIVVGMIQLVPSWEHNQFDPTFSQMIPKQKLKLPKPLGTPLPDSLYIGSLFVDEAKRRQKIASKLLDISKEKAKEMGYQQLTLLVWDGHFIANNLYQKKGFTKLKTIHLKSMESLPHKAAFILQCKI